MATETRKVDKFIDELLFETPGGRRFTQDSPVLPDVWKAFLNEPSSQQELILTVNRNKGAGLAAKKIREMLGNLRDKRPEFYGDIRKPARVNYIPGQIAVKVYFDELMRVILPLTPWWRDVVNELWKIQNSFNVSDNNSTTQWLPEFPHLSKTGNWEKDMTEALMLLRNEIDGSINDREMRTARNLYLSSIPAELCWLVRVAGIISNQIKTRESLLKKGSLTYSINSDFIARQSPRIETQKLREERMESSRLEYDQAVGIRQTLVTEFASLYNDWDVHAELLNEEGRYNGKGFIWRVTKNRRVNLAVNKSALTIKADAARRLFDISCNEITWAILDSGIDSKHHAFKRTDQDHENKLREKLNKTGSEESLLEVEDLESRVVKTLDFTRLREMLDYDWDLPHEPDASNERVAKIRKLIIKNLCGSDPSENEVAHAEKRAAEIESELRDRINRGREINWGDLEEIIEIRAPERPTNDHGTHVAGILGADWIEDRADEKDLPLSLRTRKMRGVCPDINLIDVRVFSQYGLTDEFELLAALQYLRWMNDRAGAMIVHGSNLSLSLVHRVQRFACGQTPICDECNESAALGMVIVAAAGNRGYEMTGNEASFNDNYRAATITDPGNADGVITVGSTHRKRPQEYGVSYFSSRGPTGDGRLKPDLLAPGEKIKGPTPGLRAEFKDGTSMAAPHVSGAAALLMARHSELIAKPEQIKKILCDTATDLGREKYYQGHGLIDTLRALQSI